METQNNSLDYLESLLLEIKNRYKINESETGEKMYKVPTTVVTLLALLYGTISILSIAGNGLVVFVIMKKKTMQTLTNIFIANLAVADIVLGVFATPFQFHPALYQRWDFPEIFCKIAPFVKVMSINVSVLTLTLISLDRYVAVMRPFKAGVSKRNAIIYLIIIWCLGITSSFPEGYSHYVIVNVDLKSNTVHSVCEQTWPTTECTRYYSMYLFVIQYILPLLMISFSYTRMAYRIWRTKTPGNITEINNSRQHTKLKVVKMLVIVVAVFVICWLPYQLYSVISQFVPEINEYKYINLIWFCCNWLAMSNSCYNPFIYGLFNEKFKREYYHLFSKSMCMRRLSLESHNSLRVLHAIHPSRRFTLTFRTGNSIVRSATTTNHCSQRASPLQ